MFRASHPSETASVENMAQPLINDGWGTFFRAWMIITMKAWTFIDANAVSAAG